MFPAPIRDSNPGAALGRSFRVMQIVTNQRHLVLERGAPPRFVDLHRGHNMWKALARIVFLASMGPWYRRLLHVVSRVCSVTMVALVRLYPFGTW